MIRPLNEPKSRQAMEIFWNPNDQPLEDAKHGIFKSGRGAIGLVDPNLSIDIKQLKQE